MVTSAHRFLLAVLALLVLAAPASAAEVARIDGARLDARDDRRSDFCLRLTEDESESGGGSRTCGRAPWRARRSSQIEWVHDDAVIAAGAVPAAVTRAEAELADGRRIGFDTVAGPRYRGRHAGRLRFYLAALPLTDPRDDEAGGVVAVRFFGADGTLLDAASSTRDGTQVGRTRRLLRERGRGRSITVTATVQRRLAPTPLALDRFEELTCMLVTARESSHSSGSSTLCREPGPNRPELSVYPEAGCGSVRTVLAGFVGDAVTAVRLTLGSGRVRDVPARTLRGAQGSLHRYVAAPVPRGEALRSVAAVGGAERYELAEPPGGLPCVAGSDTVLRSYAFDSGDGARRLPPGSGEQVAAEAGGHRLLVRDAEAERLCVGLDGLRADGSDCGLPAVTGDEVFAALDSGHLYAAVPAEVARVRLPDGREVAPVEGGYSGRYAGAVRFLLVRADVAPTDRVRMLDGSGAAIGSLPIIGLDSFEPEGRSARLAAGRGWRLTAARYAGSSCLALSLGGEGECVGFFGLDDDGAYATVGCAPRLAVLYGTLARRTRSVHVVLRGGRTLRARVVRIPRRAGGGRAWVLALPRKARVVALRMDGRRVTFPLLPAAGQCGYGVYAPYLSEPIY